MAQTYVPFQKLSFYTTRLTVITLDERQVLSNHHGITTAKWKSLFGTHTRMRTPIHVHTSDQTDSNPLQHEIAYSSEAMGPDKEYLLTERHREFTILNKNILLTPHLCKRPRMQTKAHTHLTRTRTYSHTHIRPTTQTHTNTPDSTLVKGQPIGDSAQSITRWKQLYCIVQS